MNDESLVDFYPDADFDLSVDNLPVDISGISENLHEELPPDANSEESESAEGTSDFHDKRKEMDDDDSENELDESTKKRKESGSSRKPGRKLLTAEPTTVSRSR